MLVYRPQSLLRYGVHHELRHGVGRAGFAPGPVSPRSWLEGIYDYAVTVMDSDKVFLGMPANGWNWQIYDTPANLGKTYRGTSNTYYATKLWMTGGYNFTDDAPPQPLIPIVTYWDDEFQLFTVNSDVEETSTRSEDISLDYEFFHSDTMTAVKCGNDYPVKITPRDINIWISRLFLGDADGFSILYYQDVDSLIYWANQAAYRWKLRRMCMWSHGQEDMRL